MNWQWWTQPKSWYDFARAMFPRPVPVNRRKVERICNDCGAIVPRDRCPACGSYDWRLRVEE